MTKSLIMGLTAAVCVWGWAHPACGDDGRVIVPHLAFSGSAVSQYEAQIAVFQGERDIYLWFWNDRVEDVQFAIDTSFEIVAFVPAPGVTNSGTDEALWLTLGSVDCMTVDDPILLGTLTVRDTTGSGGWLCPVQSQVTGRLCFQPCAEGYWQDLRGHGLTSDGSSPCFDILSGPDCQPITVESQSWGEQKAMYR